MQKEHTIVNILKAAEKSDCSKTKLTWTYKGTPVRFSQLLIRRNGGQKKVDDIFKVLQKKKKMLTKNLISNKTLSQK